MIIHQFLTTLTGSNTRLPACDTPCLINAKATFSDYFPSEPPGDELRICWNLAIVLCLRPCERPVLVLAFPHMATGTPENWRGAGIAVPKRRCLLYIDKARVKTKTNRLIQE